MYRIFFLYLIALSITLPARRLREIETPAGLIIYQNNLYVKVTPSAIAYSSYFHWSRVIMQREQRHSRNN
jgi:hypothetical protein